MRGCVVMATKPTTIDGQSNHVFFSNVFFCFFIAKWCEYVGWSWHFDGKFCRFLKDRWVVLGGGFQGF